MHGDCNCGTYNVQTTNELSIYPELGECRPVCKLLEPLPDLVVCQDVEEAISHALLAQDADGLPGEAALWCARRSLHEEHDGGSLDKLAEALVQLLLRGLRFGCAVLWCGLGVAGAWGVRCQVLRAVAVYTVLDGF